MSAYDFVLLCLAVPALAAYVCRLTLLHPSQHKWSVCAMHYGLATVSGIVVLDAVRGTAGPVDWAGVAGAVSWLVVSYKTWANGVPTYHLRDDLVWPDVEGGQRD